MSTAWPTDQRLEVGRLSQYAGDHVLRYDMICSDSEESFFNSSIDSLSGISAGSRISLLSCFELIVSPIHRFPLEFRVEYLHFSSVSML